MGSNFPGQSSRKCGQASQVDSCGSHSAGMRYPAALGRIGLRERLVIFRQSFSVEQAASDGSVGVDAAVAQEGPIASSLFQVAQVNFADQDFFFVVRCFCQHLTERIAEERSSPELESLAGRRIAADTARLKAHAIYNAD